MALWDLSVRLRQVEAAKLVAQAARIDAENRAREERKARLALEAELAARVLSDGK
jgi:hypothetical protein